MANTAIKKTTKKTTARATRKPSTATKGSAAKRVARSARSVTRQQLTIDIQDFPEVKEMIRKEAIKRQFGHSEPLLRRILFQLFIKGQLQKISI
jgi:hypothetical protein